MSLNKIEVNFSLENYRTESTHNKKHIPQFLVYGRQKKTFRGRMPHTIKSRVYNYVHTFQYIERRSRAQCVYVLNSYIETITSTQVLVRSIIVITDVVIIIIITIAL